jgi:hypothetical protein
MGRGLHLSLTSLAKDTLGRHVSRSYGVFSRTSKWHWSCSNKLL